MSQFSRKKCSDMAVLPSHIIHLKDLEDKVYQVVVYQLKEMILMIATGFRITKEQLSSSYVVKTTYISFV